MAEMHLCGAAPSARQPANLPNLHLLLPSSSISSHPHHSHPSSLTSIVSPSSLSLTADVTSPSTSQYRQKQQQRYGRDPRHDHGQRLCSPAVLQPDALAQPYPHTSGQRDGRSRSFKQEPHTQPHPASPAHRHPYSCPSTEPPHHQQTAAVLLQHTCDVATWTARDTLLDQHHPHPYSHHHPHHQPLQDAVKDQQQEQAEQQQRHYQQQQRHHQNQHHQQQQEHQPQQQQEQQQKQQQQQQQQQEQQQQKQQEQQQQQQQQEAGGRGFSGQAADVPDHQPTQRPHWTTARPRDGRSSRHGTLQRTAWSSSPSEGGGAVRLYSFLLEELEKPAGTEQRLLAWVQRNQGLFRIVRKHEVAAKWGRAKNNQSMTYEKFSRSLRYYYKVKQLEKVPGQYLVYKFSPQASFVWNIINSSQPSPSSLLSLPPPQPPPLSPSPPSPPRRPASASSASSSSSSSFFSSSLSALSSTWMCDPRVSSEEDSNRDAAVRSGHALTLGSLSSPPPSLLPPPPLPPPPPPSSSPHHRALVSTTVTPPGTPYPLTPPQPQARPEGKRTQTSPEPSPLLTSPEAEGRLTSAESALTVTSVDRIAPSQGYGGLPAVTGKSSQRLSLRFREATSAEEHRLLTTSRPVRSLRGPERRPSTSLQGTAAGTCSTGTHTVTSADTRHVSTTPPRACTLTSSTGHILTPKKETLKRRAKTMTSPKQFCEEASSQTKVFSSDVKKSANTVGALQDVRSAGTTVPGSWGCQYATICPPAVWPSTSVCPPPSPLCPAVCPSPVRSSFFCPWSLRDRDMVVSPVSTVLTKAGISGQLSVSAPCLSSSAVSSSSASATPSSSSTLSSSSSCVDSYISSMCVEAFSRTSQRHPSNPSLLYPVPISPPPLPPLPNPPSSLSLAALPPSSHPPAFSGAPMSVPGDCAGLPPTFPETSWITWTSCDDSAFSSTSERFRVTSLSCEPQGHTSTCELSRGGMEVVGESGGSGGDGGCDLMREPGCGSPSSEDTLIIGEEELAELSVESWLFPLHITPLTMADPSVSLPVSSCP